MPSPLFGSVGEPPEPDADADAEEAGLGAPPGDDIPDEELEAQTLAAVADEAEEE